MGQFQRTAFIMAQETALAAAPASIGNVAVGYDILGLSAAIAHDRVRAKRLAAPKVALGEVSGLMTKLPTAIADNTALRAADAVLKRANADFGVELDIEKGIPMSSGMGGSAASAVAAAVAVNALLASPLDEGALLACALEGETASAASPPIDNVAASLVGGLVLIYCHKTPRVTPLPLPKGLVCILVHPNFKVETRAAREILKPDVSLGTLVQHSAHVGGFVHACHTGDLDLMAACLKDVVVEPQRKQLVPFFEDAQKAALDAGAIGCSLAGSGPSIFAWAREQDAEAVLAAFTGALDAAGVRGEDYIIPLRSEKAELISCDSAAPTPV